MSTTRLFCFLLLIGLVPLAGRAQSGTGSVRVARVLEGDMLQLADGRRVHLVGVDALSPYTGLQLRRWARASGRSLEDLQSLGRLARGYARLLLDSARVQVVPAAARPTKDAYVWVTDAQGTRRFMLNARMIVDGYAYARLTRPFKQLESFWAYEIEARQNKRGLWGNTTLPALEATTHPVPPHVATSAISCQTFPSPAFAQRFFRRFGGPARDPYGLDPDGDGAACGAASIARP